MAKKKLNFIDSIAPNVIQVVVLIIAVVAAFYIGKLSTQVKYFEERAQFADAQNGNNVAPPADNGLPQVEDVSNLSLLTDGDHVRGSENAKIAIIEYSDYDCPFCGTFHTTADQIVEEYNGEVMWIYRHFPLDGLHPEARGKAIAAECAAAVGGEDAFWAFSDELFANAYKLSDMATVAQQVGLDAGNFNTCITNQNTADAVDYDIQTATEVGVQGTPGNYIVNLETQDIIPLRGAEPVENVRAVIEEIK